MLIIEYDVDSDGQCEVLALIDAYAEDGHDPDGTLWLEWRRSFEDEGHGCVVVPDEDIRLIDETEDKEELVSIVERVILADRRSKEAKIVDK
jgi:hypothetical protein